MDERRSDERRTHAITREEFVRDASDAFRHADRGGDVLITKPDGSPYAVLTVPRTPIEFDVD